MNAQDDLENDSQVQEALDALTLNERAATPPTPPTLLPWLICGISLLALLFTGLYARKAVSGANERTVNAERMRKDLQDRLAAGENGRKEDRARAVELAGKNEELSAQKADVEARLKDKDAQLVGQQHSDAVVFAKLKSIVKSAHGRGIAKQVEAVIPQGDPVIPSGDRVITVPARKGPRMRFPKIPSRY